MLLSMTGYGKGEASYGSKTITVDVRSLNGKMADIRIKSPFVLGNKELDLRKMVQDGAVRGKLDITIELQGNPLLEAGLSDGTNIRSYFAAFKQIFSDISLSDDTIFQSVVRLPNVLQSSNGGMTDEDWSGIAQATEQALHNLRDYRITEGNTLRQDLELRIREILTLLDMVDDDEADRQVAFRERLSLKFQELQQEGLDENRLEQEMLYYLDKLDINEEKVRLRQHCIYFLEVINNDEFIKGKKLNFISQEIGREMNTLGAKAQWTSIQHNVVAMKNALEEIKEQLANAL